MAFSAIVYLVLAVVSVLIAVILFVKLWNVFIGVDTTQKDVSALAATIQQMVDDNSQYENRTFLLQLGDQAVFGYDHTDADPIQLGSNNIITTHYDPVQRTTECNGRVCVCYARVSGSDISMGQCYLIKEPSGNNVRLVADYTGYVLLSGASTPPVPDDLHSTPIHATYSRFAILKELVGYIQLQNGGRQQAAGQGAIFDIMLEKRTVGNQIIITALPDTPYSQSRKFYLEQCVAGSGADPTCIGKTEYSSFNSNDGTYCRLNILNGACAIKHAATCADGKSIAEPCICGSTTVTTTPVIANYGFCTNNYVSFIYNCNAITSCEQYCGSTGGGTGSSICTPNEASLCLSNGCNVQQNGATLNCAATPTDSTAQSWYCKTAQPCTGSGYTCRPGGCLASESFDTSKYCSQSTPGNRYICCAGGASTPPPAQPVTPPADPCAAITQCVQYCPIHSANTQNGWSESFWCDTSAAQAACSQNRCNVQGGCVVRWKQPEHMMMCYPISSQAGLPLS